MVAVRFNAVPEHIGELLPNVGAGGVGLMVTVVVPKFLHDPRVTVTVYTPELAVLTGFMFGFCNVEVKPAGPDQL